MNKDEQVVEFRYLGIQAEKGEIAGICLCYGNESGAYSLFEAIHRYITAPSPVQKIPMKVEFTKNIEDLYHLHLEFGVEDTIRSVQIDGIDASYIERLKFSLLIYQYYLIVAGYTDTQGIFQLLPPKEYQLFRSDVLIDGERIRGKALSYVNWTRLFE